MFELSLSWDPDLIGLFLVSALLGLQMASCQDMWKVGEPHLMLCLVRGGHGAQTVDVGVGGRLEL